MTTLAHTGHAEHRPADVARIGPNAITRVAEALLREIGSERTQQIFATAGLAHYLRQPPETMVDEEEVIRLHHALNGALGDAAARKISRAAGLATGDYLLARRIPQPVQAILKRLPATLAARILLIAIRKHAWTFAGSGRFEASAGRPVHFSITGNPMCRGVTATAPHCDYYAATFERLFRTLVHKNATVIEMDCESCGADSCRFEIRW
jgi:divinyl protochlorophyllide a 8-vinyl-reductase